jgi:hypothetical protein
MLNRQKEESVAELNKLSDIKYENQMNFSF